MKTFEFRIYKANKRYSKRVFTTKCAKKETAIKRFRKSGLLNEYLRYRMVELLTHAEKDIAIIDCHGHINYQKDIPTFERLTDES